MFPKLNFPDVDIPLIKKGNQYFIFDVVRKKNLVAQPEEWVRQHAIHFLNKKKDFPIGMMSLEYSLKYAV